MDPEKLKKHLEEKYLEAREEIRVINKAEKSSSSSCNITNIVMSMLAVERKTTILDIYGISFPYEALSGLIAKGMAAEKGEAASAGGQEDGGGEAA